MENAGWDQSLKMWNLSSPKYTGALGKQLHFSGPVHLSNGSTNVCFDDL